MRATWSVLAIFTLLSCRAAELPEPVIPAGVGVNIHFVAGHEKDLDLIAAAGFKFVRMDFAWGGIERKKGEYDWSGYEELQANLDRRGLRALYILDYSNGLYERDNASPQHSESVEAFARWAGAAAKHFQGRHVIWEVWNEPNISFWRPKPDVQQYTALCVAACKAVREADPAATIVAPASSGFPWEFLEALFKAGTLEHLDAVSVHPYREYHRGPETAAADYRKLRELIERYAPGPKRKLPILSGEWGYATHQKGVSLETQAAFAARQQLSNLLEGVPLSIWYDWKNDGTDAKDAEHNFGTVLPDLAAKPSYQAIQLLTRELSGYRIVRRMPLENDEDYVLVCADGKGMEKLTAWTTGEPHVVNVPIRHPFEKALRIFPGTGPGFPRKLEKGRLTLELSSLPQYVTLETTSVRGE
ncbi:MAG TPA: cellulase family glycosylhydrolase [Verrucomicrobiae bacterium]